MLALSWAPSLRAAAPPRVFLQNAAQLAAQRERFLVGDAAATTERQQLERAAERALKTRLLSVMDKDQLPPSGDKHDYLSQAPYFWPNPDSLSGLPYVRHDGKRNPEIYRITDHREMSQMAGAVAMLSRAGYLTGQEKYAARAAVLLRAWFLDPATRMNPNLNYAQGVPGVNTGRGIGLIETANLPDIVDAVGLLAGSKAWTPADQRGMEDWCNRFLDWMLESQNGRNEAAARNNHGTYYDVQVVSLALFVGRRELATNVVNAAKARRIARQIEPDGRQQLELARTKSWGYSVMNLRGLMHLATLGEHVGVDLWHYETADGRGIRAALDFLLPYAFGDQAWPYPQLGNWLPDEVFPLMKRAAPKYPHDAVCQKYLLRLPPATASTKPSQAD